MRAISLTQPWASLVAAGAKSIETRSWPTSYRGQLAIHASKGFPRWAKDFALEPEIQGMLYRAGFRRLSDLPCGCVIATCRLVACRPTERSGVERDSSEWRLGDFTPGRFAFVLRDVQALPEPVPARGALGLWEWDEAMEPSA